MVHGTKPNLHDAYEWVKNIYVKIKQADKLAHQANVGIHQWKRIYPGHRYDQVGA